MTVLFNSVNIHFQSTFYSSIGPCFADNVVAILCIYFMIQDTQTFACGSYFYTDKQLGQLQIPRGVASYHI